MRKLTWRWLTLLLAAPGFALAVWLAYGLAERVAIRSLREATAHRMDIYAASLLAEMDRFEYLPPVLALNEQVAELLRSPGSAALQDVVNRQLHFANARAGASAIYLMDAQGLTLAASNWDQPTSFVRMNFAYRPYFQDAMHGLPGRFYGIGTVSREPGYYFAQAVERGGQLLGVIAVKLNLERLDEAWEHEGEKIVVADGHGVIFLSSEPNWKYRTLRALSPQTVGELAATRQYAEAGLLSPLDIKWLRRLDDGSAIVRIQAEPLERRQAGSSREYLVHEHAVLGTDWRLSIMSDLSGARAAARNSAVLAALTLVLLAVLALYLTQRRRSIAQTLAARAALQRANDELEQKVAQRTEALSDANCKLQDEIGERKRAEEALRGALADLVHTAKMAALGQMSAGITHELNQPLAALRTLSSNAIVFMQRGDLSLAQDNLDMIARLTGRMGKITSQLKKFAHKAPTQLRPVALATVVSDALFLLSQSRQPDQVAIEEQVQPPDIRAWCDANRVEQVLLNLLSNAVDAVQGTPAPRVQLRVQAAAEGVSIEVHDNGPGIPAAVLAHLFEPFFSTKEQGAGLGLGLAISADIVRELGGTLRAAESPELGGALFTLQLQAVPPTHAGPAGQALDHKESGVV